MPDQFQIYQDARSEWRWRYVAENGNNMANGGEGYKNKSDCENGIKKMKNSQDVAVVELDEPDGE